MEETLFTAIGGLGVSILTQVAKPRTKGGFGIPPIVTLVVFSLFLSGVYTMGKLYLPQEYSKNIFEVLAQILGTANMIYLLIFRNFKKHGI